MTHISSFNPSTSQYRARIGNYSQTRSGLNTGLSKPTKPPDQPASVSDRTTSALKFALKSELSAELNLAQTPQIRLKRGSAGVSLSLLILLVGSSVASPINASNRRSPQPAGVGPALPLGRRVHTVRTNNPLAAAGSVNRWHQHRHQVLQQPAGAAQIARQAPAARPLSRYVHARPQAPFLASRRQLRRVPFMTATGPVPLVEYKTSNDLITVFLHRYLKAINPTREKIFESARKNMQTVIHIANHEIKKMSAGEIVEDVRARLGMRINEAQARSMQSRIAKLSDVMKKYAKDKNHFLFYSKFDYWKAIAFYRRDNVFISDQFFTRNPVWQTFILIHELTHATGSQDFFYFSGNIFKQENGIVSELIDLPIGEAFSVFLSGLSEQMKKNAHRFNQEQHFALNADTITLYVSHLVNKNPHNRERLHNPYRLILSKENKNTFPSLVHRADRA